MGKKYTLKPEHIHVLKKLQEIGEPMEARAICAQVNMEYEKLMSGAIHSLSEAGLTTFSERNVVLISPTPEMKQYISKGLPERQMYTLFTTNGRREITILDFQVEVEKKLGLDKKLFFAGLGQMKKKKWVVSSKATGTDMILIYNEKPELGPDEVFLEKFQKKDEIIFEDIEKKNIKVEDELYKRKLLNHEKKTLRIVNLTEDGKKVKENQIETLEETLVQITPEMLKSGTWKENLSKLKKFEVNATGPRIEVGKIHPMTIIINEIREVFHSMGFQEIKGPIVETAFYNFDALYQPQDHPAREMHDTFYLKNPLVGKLPKKEFVESMKATHENGGDCGSTGWRYKWSEDIAKKVLLRTHTTATTCRQLRTIVEEKQKLPIKMFCIDRVFRNEKVDRTHLAEFQQIEGIIVGENVTLCDLIGQIVEFYKRMGFDKVVTRPGFFPYTEPSMEIAVYSNQLGRWLEMGGSGIFRPEVAETAGIKEPVRVLAWGMGLERLAMLKLKREDIRDLYQSPISWLREVPY